MFLSTSVFCVTLIMTLDQANASQAGQVGRLYSLGEVRNPMEIANKNQIR